MISTSNLKPPATSVMWYLTYYYSYSNHKIAQTNKQKQHLLEFIWGKVNLLKVDSTGGHYNIIFTLCSIGSKIVFFNWNLVDMIQYFNNILSPEWLDISPCGSHLQDVSTHLVFPPLLHILLTNLLKQVRKLGGWGRWEKGLRQGDYKRWLTGGRFWEDVPGRLGRDGAAETFYIHWQHQNFNLCRRGSTYIHRQ